MCTANSLATITAASRSGDATNQDRYFIGDGYAVVLDGASTPDPAPLDGGWYAEVLGGAIGRRLRIDPPTDLRSTLSAAIQETTERGSLTPDTSPSSTVTIVRWTTDILDALVLGDSPLVIQTAAGIEHLRDDRLAGLTLPEREAYRAALRQGGGYGERHRNRMRRLVEAERSQRNQPGGYWIAGAEPRAAQHAFTGRWATPELRAVMLATDGVSRGVDQFGTPASWDEAMDIARTDGPDSLLRIVEDAESSDADGCRWPRGKRHDDKTAVLLCFPRTCHNGPTRKVV